MIIYILTIADYENYGYGTMNADVFFTKEEATEKMREQYLERCNEWKITEPYNNSDSWSFTDDYAYISGEFYWDIFTKEIKEG